MKLKMEEKTQNKIIKIRNYECNVRKLNGKPN